MRFIFQEIQPRLLHYLEQSDESVKLLKYLLNSARHI